MHPANLNEYSDNIENEHLQHLLPEQRFIFNDMYMSALTMRSSKLKTVEETHAPAAHAVCIISLSLPWWILEWRK